MKESYFCDNADFMFATLPGMTFLQVFLRLSMDNYFYSCQRLLSRYGAVVFTAIQLHSIKSDLVKIRNFIPG